MKLKTTFFLLFSLFVSHLAQGADNYKVGDKLYVWAKSGLNIRSSPSVKGKKVGKFAKGDAVIIQSISDQKFNIKEIEKSDSEKNPFILRGTWVKVKNSQFEGYVIDIYLLKLMPPKQDMTFYDYLQSFQKEVLEVDTIKLVKECDPGKTCYTSVSISKNGLKHHIHSFDKYWETLEMPDMTIAEGYVFSSFFLLFDQPISRILEKDSLHLDKNFADRLILTEDYYESPIDRYSNRRFPPNYNKKYGGVGIKYIQQDQGLLISIGLSEESDYFQAIRPNLYKIYYADSDEKVPNDYLEMNHISPKKYNAVKGLPTISTKPKKELVSYQDSTMFIKLGNGEIRTFMDKDCSCESNDDYTYDGHIEEFNVFAISHMGWEDYSYVLYDSFNGEEVLYTAQNMFISPDRKYLVSIDFDPYEEASWFSVAKIENNHIKKHTKEFGFLFPNWTIVDAPKWINASTFVLKAKFPPFINENKDYKYLKIKILKR